ncbi:MAG: hypothetical protein R6W70_06455 [bacterium]
MKKIFRENYSKIFIKRKGVALFVSMLLSLSVAVVSLSTMNRIAMSSRSSGDSLSDKKLLNYAHSAALIASAEVQHRLTGSADSDAVYIINGNSGPKSFVFYPVDITTFSPDINFAYRAVARRFSGMGQTPPGAKTSLGSKAFCYDITVDVKEVFYVGPGSWKADAEVEAGNNYFFGKAKSIGIISCFDES